MFVRRNGSAKRHVSQVLQSIRERVILRVARPPQAVALREFLRRKSGKPQEVVRPIFDHVDSQVVSRVDAKVWPMCIAQSESFKFQETIEGRMLHALDFWNVHQALDRLRVVNHPVRRKHRPQLKRQDVWIASTCLSIDVSNLCGSLSQQARGLKQNGYSVETNDDVDLPAI